MAITPKQAAQAGLPKELIDSLVTRQPGKNKLIRDNAEQAKEIFNDG